MVLSRQQARNIFDEDFYLENNRDVARAIDRDEFDGNALDHFLEFGLKEGRSPNADIASIFDEQRYLEANDDVAAAVEEGTFANGLEHFLAFGDEEGREGFADFDEEAYLEANQDVADAVDEGDIESGFAHFLQFGQEEGREAPQRETEPRTVTLTRESDTAEARSSRGTLFEAPLVAATSEFIDQSEVNTLTSSDVISGREDAEDTLRATLTSPAGNPGATGESAPDSITPEISNVEEFVLTAVDGSEVTLDASLVSGVEEITNERSSGDLEVSNLSENAKLVMNRNSGDFAVNFSPTGIAEIGDEAVEAELIGVNNSDLEITGGIEALNLSSNEVASTLSNFNIGEELTELTIDGDADLEIESGFHPNVETIDVTEFEGALTLATGGIEDVEIVVGDNIAGLDINLENENFTPEFSEAPAGLDTLNISLQSEDTGLDLSNAEGITEVNLDNEVGIDESQLPEGADSTIFDASLADIFAFLNTSSSGSQSLKDIAGEFTLDGAENLEVVSLQGEPIGTFNLEGDSESLELNIVEDFEIGRLNNEGDELTELALSGDGDLEIASGSYRNLERLNLSNFNGSSLIFATGLSEEIAIQNQFDGDFSLRLENDTTIDLADAGDIDEVTVLDPIEDRVENDELTFANADGLEVINLDFEDDLTVRGSYQNLTTLDATNFSDFNLEDGEPEEDNLNFNTGGSGTDNSVDIELGRNVGEFTIGLENDFAAAINDGRTRGNEERINTLNVELLENGNTLDLSDSGDITEVNITGFADDINEFTLVSSPNLELLTSEETPDDPLIFNLEGDIQELTLDLADNFTFEEFNSNNLVEITVGGPNLNTVTNPEVIGGEYENLSTLIVGDDDGLFISGDILFSTGGSNSIEFQGLVDENGDPHFQTLNTLNRTVLSLEDDFTPGLGELDQFAEDNPNATLPLNVALQSNEITLDLANAGAIGNLNVQNVGDAEDGPWQFEVTNSGNLETITFDQFDQFRTDALDEGSRALTDGNGLVLDSFESLEFVDARELNGLTFDFSDSNAEEGIGVFLGDGENTITSGSNEGANFGDFISVNESESENTFVYESVNQAIDGDSPFGPVDAITGLTNLDELDQFEFEFTGDLDGLSFDADFDNYNPAGLDEVFDSANNNNDSIGADEVGFINLLGSTWIVGNLEDGDQFQDGDFLVRFDGGLDAADLGADNIV